MNLVIEMLLSFLALGLIAQRLGKSTYALLFMIVLAFILYTYQGS